jgi:hypothetical protein
MYKSNLGQINYYVTKIRKFISSGFLCGFLSNLNFYLEFIIEGI